MRRHAARSAAGMNGNCATLRHSQDQGFEIMKTVKVITSVASAAVLVLAPLTVHAEMVDTSTMLALEQAQVGYVLPGAASAIDRAQLHEQLEALGVSPALAAERIAAMTDAQLQQLSAGLQDMPAGSGALGVVATVLVIILLLEILGITNISRRV